MSLQADESQTLQFTLPSHVVSDLKYLTDNSVGMRGHSTGSLKFTSSLTSLYIDPLASILTHQNPPAASRTDTALTSSTTSGAPINEIFENNPIASLTLLLDVKSNGAIILPVILQQLEPLVSRGYLTHFNSLAVIPGPITVVGSGNTPFNLPTSNTTYGDIFFDAHLDQLLKWRFEWSHMKNS